MEKICKIIVHDQVNISLKGLDVVTRRNLVNAVRYFVPSAKHTPLYRMKRWDGYVSLCTTGGDTYLNLLPILHQIIEDAGYDFELDDLRQDYDFQFTPIDENYWAHVKWPDGHRLQGEPILMHKYQVEAANTFLENTQGIQELPTSFGKSLLICTLCHKVEPYGRTITIVPTKDLISQSEEDFKLLGLDVGVFFGDRKDFNHKHLIITWQSLMRLDRNNKDGLSDIEIQDFLKDVVCFIGDEAHLLASNKIKGLFTGPLRDIPIRWGMTGTIPKDPLTQANLNAIIGNTLDRIRAKDLQDDGILSNCKIHIEQVKDSYKPQDFMDETKYVAESDELNQYWAKRIQELSETGNVLILLDRKAAGKKLQKLLPNSVFLSGENKSSDRKKEYKSINTEQNAQLLCTFGIASTGINIPRIFHLVLICSGKAFTRTIQSIGRALRRAEDKDFANIWDFCTTNKFNNRHLKERITFYDDASYPHDKKMVSL